jgi:hypothetical protein
MAPEGPTLVDDEGDAEDDAGEGWEEEPSGGND